MYFEPTSSPPLRHQQSLFPTANKGKRSSHLYYLQTAIYTLRRVQPYNYFGAPQWSRGQWKNAGAAQLRARDCSCNVTRRASISKISEVGVCAF